MENERQQMPNGWPLALVAAGLVVFYVVGYVIGGELTNILAAGLQTIPFALLAVLAYLGVNQTWAKVVSLLYLGLLVAAVGFVGLTMSFAVVSDLTLSNAGNAAPGLNLDRAEGLRMLAIFLGSVTAVVIGALGFIPGVRRWLSHFLPIDPNSFVHMVAVVAVVALMLLSFIPLIVLGAPPILALINTSSGAADLTGGQDDAAQLRSTVYGLIWTVPGTIIAVGYAIRRNLGAALNRLGLVRPTIQQVVIGIVAAVGLVLIGITAGLGEELAVRGVLQPRLGILLSNLFFTGLHAFQYNWDSLLIVFTVGMVLGVIRKRTNTTTSAITHGVYDFLLIMASVLSIPGFTE
jgi:hypothetical protein